MLNRHLHLHVKVREKHHPINPVKSFHSHGVNLGLILLVFFASAATWFLAEFTVLKIQDISNNYDSAALDLVKDFRPSARAQMIYFKESFEDYEIGYANSMSNYGRSCDPPNMIWYPMMSSAWVTTEVSDLVDARYGDKYMRVWGTVPEGMCHEQEGIVSGVDEIFKGGGTFRGFDDTSKTCHAMEWGWDYWIGFSVYIPEDYYPEYRRQMIFQLKDTAEQGNPCFGFYSYGEDDVWRWLISGVASGNLPDLTWTEFRGTWVDIVLHTIPGYSSSPNPNSILEIYINGERFILRGPNQATCRDTNLTRNILAPTMKQYFMPIMYNTSFATRIDGVYTALPENVAQCDESIVGSPTPEFTRENNYDEFVITESRTIGVHGYCTVAPPIWSSAPVVNSPASYAVNVDTSPTISYGGYQDHRDDIQNCFSYAFTQIQIDEQGGDWSSLVYDSRTAGQNSQNITGLIAGTSYQLRVRHASQRTGTNETYDGDWSETVFFSTGSFAPDPATACSDNTPLNTCATNLAPRYCNASAQLVDNCQACGCRNDWICQTNGSCRENTTTSPTPVWQPVLGSCHYRPQPLLPPGYGTPYDPVSAPDEFLLRADCAQNSASFSIGRNRPQQLIWPLAYIWHPQNSWQPITLHGPASVFGPSWIQGSAQGSYSLSRSELSLPQNLIAYICTWDQNRWKCGCRDQNCSTSNWQLLRFGGIKTAVATPPPATDPPPADQCGNEVCDSGETYANCPADCREYNIVCTAMSPANSSAANKTALQNCMESVADEIEKIVLISANASQYNIENMTINEGITIKGETSGGNETRVNTTFWLSNDSTLDTLHFANRSRSVVIGDPLHVTGITIQNCTFNHSANLDATGNPAGNPWATIHAFRMSDSTIDNNTFNNQTGDYPDGTKPGQNIVVVGGKRNRIINNTITGGKTSIIFKPNTSLVGPTLQLWDNYVGGNTVSRPLEEGISFDVVGNDGNQVAAMENDFIASVGSRSLTLAHANWTGATKDYSGWDMVFVSGNLMGQTRAIATHSGNTFTLSETIAGAVINDQVVIGATFKGNVVENNTVNYRSASGILFFGMAFNNRILNNTTTGGIAVRSLDDLYKVTGSVTDTCGRAPSGYNLVQGNTVGLNVWLHFRDNTSANDPNPCISAYPPYYSYGNTAINNTIGDRLLVNNQHIFRSGNIGTEAFTNVTLLDSSPIFD